MGVSTSRLANDPYKYIRRVKGGKYQARPYDQGERYNLGLFPTREAAARAIGEFWWGKRPDKPRHVKPVRKCDGSVKYRAVIVVPLGEYESQEAAFDAVKRYVKATCGMYAEEVLRRQG